MPRWPLELESGEKQSSASGGILGALRRHAIAAVALFVALGGSAYAAVTLEPESVGSREIANHSVESEDLARGAVTTMKIEPNGVTPSRIAPNAVNSDDVEDGSLTLADNDLEAAGYRVTRFTADQVLHDPEDTLARTRRALGAPQ